MGFTCIHYEKHPSGCKYYLKGGSCTHPQHFMCDEWVKKNHPKMYEMTQKVLAEFEGSRIVAQDIKS